MKNCHDDVTINSMMGKKVCILFTDQSVEVGILTVPFFGHGYLLETGSYNVRFYKSHVKRIELLHE